MMPPDAATPKRIRKRLFPLHLTPFENYMLLDDRRGHPMTFLAQLTFSGKIHQESFERALDYARQRHPLLRAILQPVKQNRNCWVDAEERRPLVDWGSIEDPIKFEEDEYIDLSREVGLRLWIRHDDTRAVVTAQFHHSVCDGVGSYQFLGDLLWSYASQTCDQPPDEPSPLEPTKLRERLRASYDVDQYRDAAGKIESAWSDATNVLFRKVAPLRCPTRSDSAGRRPVEFPGMRSHVFDKAEYRRLRLAVQQQGQNANDLILEKLFQTLDQWNAQRGVFRSPASICVMMPLNLRETADDEIPAANIVTHSFIRRSRRVIRDAERLRKSLAEELVQIKRDRHHLRFMHLLAGAQQLNQKMMRTLINISGCLATVVLSNIGDPTRQFHADFPRNKNGTLRCGNLELEDIDGVPPMRPKTRVSIAVITFRRVLKICMRCDPQYFTTDDTQQLLDALVDNIRDVIRPEEESSGKG